MLRVNDGLKECEKFDEPLFTPATKEELGKHDENISFDKMIDKIGIDNATSLKEYAINVYKTAANIAEQKGIVVEEIKTTSADAFSNLITLIAEGDGKRRTIAGTLFEGAPRIVGLRDYAMDFTPEEHMLLLHYADRPGMIGKIGTIMGKHEINIGSMNLGRREKKGEAMVILSLDSAVPVEVIEEIRLATDASFIRAIHMTTV